MNIENKRNELHDEILQFRDAMNHISLQLCNETNLSKPNGFNIDNVEAHIYALNSLLKSVKQRFTQLALTF